MRLVPTLAVLALMSTACRSTPSDKGGGIDGVDTGEEALDADGDGYLSDEDCDDDDPEINPGSAEVCDGLDNDCDGEADEGLDATWYTDADGDGYGDPDNTIEACEHPEGTVATGTDCDDSEATVYPGGLELCDDLDNDCDGLVDEDEPFTWYADEDGDGYGDPDGDTVEDCAAVEGYSVDPTDCDDTEATVFPGAEELCNEVDDDCDGTIDEGVTTTFYVDTDSDGYGDDLNTIEACDQPSGTSDEGGDCDDNEWLTFPGAPEYCDEVDSDCDGDTDDPDAVDAPTWYTDADSDGYGDPGTGSVACDQPAATADNDDDCDDTEAEVNPDATEVCNEVDDDCDGLVDDDDSSLDTSTGSTWYTDSDGDGEGDAASSTLACDQPTGAVSNDDDCDDDEAAVNTSASEVCDGVDNDCDGATDDDDASVDLSTASTWYADDDSDTYGDASDSSQACDQPAGTTSDATDCDDTDADINPGADEVCNEVDDDCDGLIDDDDSSVTDQQTWYVDDDKDDYGDASNSTVSCEQPSGFVADDTDCDDTEEDINPDADEVCNEVDDDCDGLIDDDDSDLDTSTADTWWPDDDLDGYGDADGTTVTACEEPSGYVDDDSDCDDTDGDVNPDATEDCNGYDDDCDGDADDSSVCPCSVEYYSSDTEHPYMFCESSETWADALSECEAYGYHLLTIDDASENTWADSTADTYSTGKWWMGINDITTEGTFEWQDGTTVSYTNWHSGEPNDSGGNEDCGQLNRYTDESWNDEPCSSSFYFICEAG